MNKGIKLESISEIKVSQNGNRYVLADFITMFKDEANPNWQDLPFGLEKRNHPLYIDREGMDGTITEDKRVLTLLKFEGMVVPGATLERIEITSPGVRFITDYKDRESLVVLFLGDVDRKSTVEYALKGTGATFILDNKEYKAPDEEKVVALSKSYESATLKAKALRAERTALLKKIEEAEAEAEA